MAFVEKPPKSPRLELGSSINDVINIRKPILSSWKNWTPEKKAKALLIAKKRREIQELIYNPKLNDFEVARRIAELGLKIDRERIRQLRLKKGITTVPLIDIVRVYSIIVKNPQITYKELAEKLEVTYFQASGFCHNHGIHLRNSLIITQDEKTKIERFFRSMGIDKVPGYRRDVNVLVDRYLFYSELGIVVEDHPWILFRTQNLVLNKIIVFDSLKLNWKDNPHLFSTSLKKIEHNINLFESLGIIHDLDHLLAYSFEYSKSGFNDAKYNKLRNAITKKDISEVLRWIPGFVTYSLRRLKIISRNQEYFDIGRESALEVLGSCKFFTNPSLILSIISENIIFRLRAHWIKTSKEVSLDNLREVYDADSENGVGFRPKYRDED